MLEILVVANMFFHN